jgi:hypothetical protein
MLSRSDWGVGQISPKGLTHALSVGQNPVGFHGPRIAGWLVFLNGCHRGEDMRLPVGETKIGSSWLNDCVITGVGISSKHAIIRMGIGEGSISQVSADKVVKINNQNISSHHTFEDGNLISIGEVHCVIRFSEQMSRGFQVPDAPKPTTMPTQSSLKEVVCGWLVMTRGIYLGQDFRLVNSNCRIGSAIGNEVTIPDVHLHKHAITLCVSTKECKISWIADGVRVQVNGVDAGVDTLLKESDLVNFDHMEGYIKWYRS